MEQEWLFEFSDGRFVAARIEPLPPGFDGMVTDFLGSKEDVKGAFYRRIVAETNSSPAKVFAKIFGYVSDRVQEAGSNVRLTAVNNPSGCDLLSVQEQKDQVGNDVAVTVQPGPLA
jgi:hypothetical protein